MSAAGEAKARRAVSLDPGAPGRIGVIARKEVIDLLRDRRTLMLMLITSIAAGPLFLMLVLNLAASQGDRARTLHLPVIGPEHAPALVAFLQRQQVVIEPAPTDAAAKIRSGDLDVVLDIDAKFGADVEAGKPGTVRLLYDRSRDRARTAIDRAESLLHAYNREWGRARLLLRGIAPEVVAPLQIEAHDYATPQSSGSPVLFLVAYYGLFAAIMGGMAVALDATAGERERQSLEPLLMTPARPAEIAVGKWLAVSLLNAIVVILTLTGFYLALRFGPLPSVGIPFLFGSVEFARFLVVLAPVILLLPALLLYVGSRGRTFKEAQANVSVLLLVVSIIPVLQMFAAKKESPWLPLIPISGQYALLGRALRGEALPAGALAMSYAVPIVLTVIALWLVARLLGKESMFAGK